MAGTEKTRPDADATREEEAQGTPRIGKGDTWNVAGSGEQQPEVAEGPVEGLEPGEQVERRPWRAPEEVDAPPVTEEEPGEDVSDASLEEDARGPHDPGGSPEDEGIPDLQAGTPEQQRASDPQQAPVPGDSPTAATRSAPTPEEMREGGTLDERLAEEEPEQPTEQEPGPSETVSPEEPGAGRDNPELDSPAPEGPGPSPRSGRLYEEAEPAPPRRQDIHAEETGTEGLSAEEEAVRTVDEDEA